MDLNCLKKMVRSIGKIIRKKIKRMKIKMESKKKKANPVERHKNIYY